MANLGMGKRTNRGWRVVHKHLDDSLDTLVKTHGRDRSDGQNALAREAAAKVDRALHRILVKMYEDSTEFAVWSRAQKVRTEARAALADRGWPMEVSKRWNGVQKPPEEEFFPHEWWRTLSEDLVAELVVEAFAQSFCDAFVDGAVSMFTETVEPEKPVLPVSPARSSSDSCLVAIPASRPWGPWNKPFDQLPPKLSYSKERQAEGFVQRGLMEDSREAWTAATRYHAIDGSRLSAESEIRKQIQMSRPTRPRRPARDPELDRKDHGFPVKYVKPISALHFPEEWDMATASPVAGVKAASPTSTRGGAPVDAGAAKGSPEKPWLYTIGESGRTLFPYSLASHKAFLESQKTPELRRKAEQLVPLRIGLS